MRYTGRLTTTLIAIFVFVICLSASHSYMPIQLKYLLLGVAILSFSIAWYLGYHYDKTKYVSEQDKLTCALNRSYIDQVFPKLIARMKRKRSVCSITILDLDDLKTINDTEGHQKGDDLLKRVSHLIRSNIRQSDIFARWGGDEFIIIAPFTSSDQMDTMIDNIMHIQFANKIYFSYGVSCYPEDAQDLDELVNKADERMYLMKGNKKVGKNFNNHSEDSPYFNSSFTSEFLP